MQGCNLIHDFVCYHKLLLCNFFFIIMFTLLFSHLCVWRDISVSSFAVPNNSKATNWSLFSLIYSCLLIFFCINLTVNIFQNSPRQLLTYWAVKMCPLKIVKLRNFGAQKNFFEILSHCKSEFCIFLSPFFELRAFEDGLKCVKCKGI